MENQTLQLDTGKTQIRPIQYRDLEAIAILLRDCHEKPPRHLQEELERHLQHIASQYALVKLLSWLPNPCQNDYDFYVAENQGKILGLIKVVPFNITRSTWQVQAVISPYGQETGTQLLRHCLETVLEARTWILEVEVNSKQTLGLYRQSGFQPLAQITYWHLSPETLKTLGEHPVELPNLLPVNNVDAYLLCQLDTVSMPPLLRQVFDRHIPDFKNGFFKSVINHLRHWFHGQERIQGYVFEPQRKAAIGHFDLLISGDRHQPHQVKLTVHPAYTWLYRELMAKIAQILQNYPPQPLQVASADFQPEREEYLEKWGADRQEQTLLMSRSVWHKLREAKPLESLQLSGVLQGLTPSRSPIPSRFHWLNSPAFEDKPENRPTSDTED